MREKYEKELRALHTSIISMGKMIEIAIESVILALMSNDSDSLDAIIANDDAIDEMEKEIERQCIKMLLLQQPVATDLRTITAALKMVTDMERIGDHAGDIAELVKELPGVWHGNINGIQQMGTEIQAMLHDSIDAYINRDISKAQDVIMHDDIVDDLYHGIKKDLVRQIQERTGNGEQIADCLLIVKYFERIGDHAVNIAEWVIFSITGSRPDSCGDFHPCPAASSTPPLA